MTSIQRASVHNGQPYRYQEATEDDDDDWSPKMPRSAIRYTTTDRTPVITSGNRRYILHEGVPPQQTTPLPHQKAAVQPRHRVHWSLIFGIGMVAMLSLWVLGNMLVNWWNITQDDIHYGRPRTFQVDAVVGHNDSVSSPSHFIAINFNLHIQIIEFPGGDTTHARIYQGATLYGDGQNLAVVTLTFKDVNGDGKPDMIINVANTHIIYINDGGQFRPLKPGEQVNQ
jgi:hypothetical protein